MVFQFSVTLMNAEDFITHLVNCANAQAAQHICEGLFPRFRVISVELA